MIRQKNELLQNMWKYGVLLGLAWSFTATRASTVWAAGDIAVCGALGNQERTAELIHSQLKPEEWVLALGDNAYSNGSLSEYRNCYHPSWGKFKSQTLPILGNHEYQTQGGAGFKAYFPEVNNYYSKTIDHWKIVALDSNLSGKAQEAQEAWLEAELKNTTANCVLAMWHHPLYSSGLHGNNPHTRSLWAILQKYRADVVLGGHDHHYERFALQDSSGNADAEGMRQFVVGTGGAPLYRTLALRPSSEKHVNGTHGVLKLELLANSYQWQFLGANTRYWNKTLDSGKTQCHTK